VSRISAMLIRLMIERITKHAVQYNNVLGRSAIKKWT
jgi:hypothetical protein